MAMTNQAVSRLLGLFALLCSLGAIAVGVAMLLGHETFAGGSSTLITLLVVALLLLVVALGIRRRTASSGK